MAQQQVRPLWLKKLNILRRWDLSSVVDHLDDFKINEYVKSETFQVNGVDFYIMLYPKGKKAKSEGSCAIYLYTSEDMQNDARSVSFTVDFQGTTSSLTACKKVGKYAKGWG